MGPNPKNKGTLLSSTFKVEEKKVPLFFGFGTSGLRYGHFVIFMKAMIWSQIKKKRKGPYLSPEVPNSKNKGTFFSSTLKVEESKVPLFFGLEAPGQIYGPFLFFLIWLQIIAFIKMKKWPYLSPEVPNPKNKGTLFSSTFKVGEKKLPLFFGFGPM